MHIFYTNKVPRVVLQFLWTVTHLGGEKSTCRTSQTRPHHQARPALQVRPAWQVRPVLQVRPTLPGAAAPTPYHILGPKHFLPRVHNLDERD
jgi:hypothetical protein